MTAEAMAELIRAETTKAGTSAVEDAVFGTDDPMVIARALGALLREVTDAAARPLTYCSSVGCVLSVELAGGQEVVVKAYQARWGARFLSAVHRLQTHLTSKGFPCPAPIAGPAPVLAGLALVDAHRPDPGSRPPTPAMLPTSAAGLARLVDLCRGLDTAGLDPHPMDPGAGDLYPPSHSPLFDFEATSGGAGWIDDLALAARRARDGAAASRVIAHTDWSARNVRMDEQRLRAVYDWDSLAVVPEPVAVGQAAATWSAIDGGQPAPTCGEVAAYVCAYETARGHPFTDQELGAAGAAALYVLAYTARCEHAVDPEEQVHRRARPRLRDDGAALLDLPALVRRHR